ncbi:MAG: type III-B CRISPR module RAMP protein Cmr6 [Eubacteriales bacterium]
MHFHPADTCAIYDGINNKEDIDQLWYRVHCFQQKSLERDSNKRLEVLNRELKLNNLSRTFIDKRLKLRRSALLAGLQSTHSLAILDGKLNGKLLHGLGGAHVRETSLTLHPLYGVPYIPASSIKGVVRNWVIQAFFDGQEKKIKLEQEENQENKDIRRVFADIFGSEEQKGQVEFFDAFVDIEFTLQPDVLTIHFPDYYRGKCLPGDNQNPNPVNFYAISSKSVQFMAGICREAKLSSRYSGNEILELALVWLENALIELGIGSKSSAGYGYFTEFNNVTEKYLLEDNPVISVKTTIKQNQEKRGVSNTSNCNKKIVVIEEPPIDFTPTQKLVYEIEHFTDNDLLRSKDKHLFERVVELGVQGEKGPAIALKAYWEQNGAWKAESKKQKLKIARIKEILEE